MANDIFYIVDHNSKKDTLIGFHKLIGFYIISNNGRYLSGNSH